MADQPTTIQQFLQIVRQYGFEYFGFYYGKYRGIIVSNQDPQKLGRVQVRIPQIAGDNKLSYWAWPSGQPAGADFGDFMIPPKGSPVWITFENGNPSYPVWEGGHWGKSAAGVPSGSTGNPQKRIKASEKWRLEFDDENDKIFLESKAGGHKFEIHGNGDINMIGGGDYTQECINFSLSASGTGTFNVGGVEFSFGGGELTISSGGSSISIGGSGVTIMGKDFLTHQHTGVEAGAGSSGGVL